MPWVGRGGLMPAALALSLEQLVELGELQSTGQQHDEKVGQRERLSAKAYIMPSGGDFPILVYFIHLPLAIRHLSDRTPINRSTNRPGAPQTRKTKYCRGTMTSTPSAKTTPRISARRPPTI